MAKIDPKWLDGLTLRYAEKTTVEKGGRKTLHAIAKQRPLREEDMLSWRDCGDKVVIVGNDGMKHTVEKNPKSKAKEDPIANNDPKPKAKAEE